MDEVSEESYLSFSNPDDVITVLLKDNPNNSIRIGYKFSIDDITYKITDITIPNFVNPEINEVNAGPSGLTF